MKTLKVSKAIKSLVAVAFAAISSVASAVPALQLGILGGVYDTTTQTVVATSDSFSLYAYLKPTESTRLSDTYYLSMALMGDAVKQPGGDLGSFSVNGTTYRATQDMMWGTPPLEAYLAADRGDLASHGVFPTYFSELSFKFSSSDKSGVLNTQDQPGVGPQAGTGLYYKLFNIDLSGLDVGLSLHFDLYNETLKNCLADIDVNKFAPFSHDAEGSKVSPVPLPAAAWLFGSALFGFIAISNRRKI
jgi:hypothetical protein